MIPLVTGMLSSLVMGGIRSLLGGGGQPGAVGAIPTSMTGMPIGRAPVLPSLANYPRYADGGMAGGIAGLPAMPPIPPGETPQMAYAMDKGGMIRGPGGGVDDLIAGTIDNRNKVLLSDGEYVVPARVVSALGDGSSEAGAKVLDGMVARVKGEAVKRIHDNGEINHNRVMPA